MKPAKFTPVVVAPVTFETVRERLSYLEGLNAKGAGTAVKSQQFEIACLRELLVRLESRTVTINTPDARDEDYDWDGQTPSEAFNTCRMICALMFRQSLRAAGIKVEAE